MLTSVLLLDRDTLLAAVRNKNYCVTRPPMLDLYVEETAKDILGESTPAKFPLVQEKLKYLLKHIDGTTLIKKLTRELTRNIDDDEFRRKLVMFAARRQRYEMVTASKPIYFTSRRLSRVLCSSINGTCSPSFNKKTDPASRSSLFIPGIFAPSLSLFPCVLAGILHTTPILLALLQLFT